MMGEKSGENFPVFFRTVEVMKSEVVMSFLFLRVFIIAAAVTGHNDNNAF
jgi:hypothetical protein